MPNNICNCVIQPIRQLMTVNDSLLKVHVIPSLMNFNELFEVLFYCVNLRLTVTGVISYDILT